MRPMSLGIVGCGNVMTGAYTTLLKPLVAEGAIRRIAVCDIDAAKAQRAADIYGDVAIVADHHAVINGDDVDIVVVLTSMAEHGPYALDALRAGKHVFVEKPMAVTRDVAAELVATARAGDRHLVCAPAVILSPTYRSMAEKLRAGAIGRPALARARYGWAGPDWSDWYYRESGGPLFDLGVYNVTSLTGLLGPVRGVQAMAGIVTPRRAVGGDIIEVGTFDNYQISLDFGDGVFGVVTTGFSMQRYRSPAIEIYGSEGTMQMLGDDWAPEGYELWENRLGAWQVFDAGAPAWSWTNGLRHLIECAARGSTPVMTPEHAFHVLDIMLTAIDAGKQRSYLAVESTFEMPDLTTDVSTTPAHRVHDRTSV
jgi:predicted dehydrogenase